ncbi:glucosamine-6-phosphate deaminase [Fusarium sp. NRRL 52700]|nr:glucosamine-6-phosphate deaminase [Fusarium sp. NRRL 52700]
MDWAGLQFKSATANNGRRKSPQQHYVLQIPLFVKSEGATRRGSQESSGEQSPDAAANTLHPPINAAAGTLNLSLSNDDVFIPAESGNDSWEPPQPSALVGHASDNTTRQDEDDDTFNEYQPLEGSSPIPLYSLMVGKYRSGEIPFKNIVTFNMDEYLGIPRGHEQSYHTFVWPHLFPQINIQAKNVHVLNGNGLDLEAECDNYEAAISAVGGINLFLAGIGASGHLAFNEPGSSLASRARVKTLAYEMVLNNARFFDNGIDKVSYLALAVDVKTLPDAQEVVMIALEARKAVALQKCIEHGVNHI